jgi:hypothetical protein
MGSPCEVHNGGSSTGAGSSEILRTETRLTRRHVFKVLALSRGINYLSLLQSDDVKLAKFKNGEYHPNGTDIIPATQKLFHLVVR